MSKIHHLRTTVYQLILNKYKCTETDFILLIIKIQPTTQLKILCICVINHRQEDITSAGGISVFNLPVNMSLHKARCEIKKVPSAVFYTITKIHVLVVPYETGTNIKY